MNVPPAAPANSTDPEEKYRQWLPSAQIRPDYNFGNAPFFVSPARHVEAQEMSGTCNKQTNKTTSVRTAQQSYIGSKNTNAENLPVLFVNAMSHLFCCAHAQSSVAIYDCSLQLSVLTSATSKRHDCRPSTSANENAD